MTLGRRFVAETIGTALLLIAVVGSGIMAERLAGGNIAIALLANALATGGALVALILTFGSISGAHFNPVVTLALGYMHKTRLQEILLYCFAQFSGAMIGVLIAHCMFSMPLLELSTKDRSGSALFFSEMVATFGLLAVIISGVKSKSDSIPFAVAAYITGAYWFTSSTSFANPAVTLARAFTESFSGIDIKNVPFFIAAQFVALCLSTILFLWLYEPKVLPAPQP